MRSALLLCLAALAGGGLEPLFGDNGVVRPARGTLLEESFVHGVLREKIAAAGYEISPEKALPYDELHESIKKGDFHYTASHWRPLHRDLVDNNVVAFGPITFGVIGIYVDKRSADKFALKSLEDLTPEVVHHFGYKRFGKSSAQIIGCPESFACHNWMKDKLAPYDLNRFISVKPGCYSDNVVDGINDFVRGEPLMLVAWQPFWFFDVLKRDVDVVALYEEPLSVYILANKTWIEDNPKIGKIFATFNMHVKDIAAQNYRMRQGEFTHRDIRRHVHNYLEKPVG